MNAPLPAYILATPIALVIVLLAFYYLIKYAVKNATIEAHKEINKPTS